jgi:restriction system protein
MDIGIDISYHYPPELMSLMIDAIPLLCRSKNDVILFFKGAGVPATVTNPLVRRINKDKESIKKHEIARAVLSKLNEKGEVTLRERREVLKRVVEFEDFSTCWPSDQLRAKGLVAEIRRVVNVKDSFTRMQHEREEERRLRQAEHKARVEEQHRRQNKLEAVKTEFYALFKEANPNKRGKALEKCLNNLFEASGILIRESFEVVGSEGEGIIEQIDGVVELEGHVYLVEMKWLREPVSKGDVSVHLVRVFNREHSRGIVISASGFTEPAITVCRESLSQMLVVLCSLEEIVMVLEQEKDLKKLIKEKVNAAIIHKNPMYEPLKFNLL